MVMAPAMIKEVKKVIKKMKASNSRGDSEVTGWMMKILSGYMCVALTHLGNKVFETGRFPQSFKIARILLLKKQGKPSDDFDGFRPINN